MDGRDLDQADDDKSTRSRMNLEKEGLSLFFVHLWALFKKRAAIFRRDKKAWICTTILPSIFVLLGFIIYAVASAKRDLQPVVLNLDDFNTGVSGTIQNPILYNGPDNPYTCQPGKCAYDQDENMALIDGYAFCGAPGNLERTGDYSCTIDESTETMDTLMDFEGTAPVETDADSVKAVSFSLHCPIFVRSHKLFTH